MMKVEEGEALLEARQLDEAHACFVNAERTGEDADRCAAGRWMVAMLRGRFDRAWHESDSILKRGKADPHALWTGEPIDGKHVMLRCLHGFGDSVQFLRYLPALRQRAAQVTLQVAPRFVDLARCFADVEEVIAWSEEAPVKEPVWDVQVEVMQLPYLFRTSLSELPLAVNYLNLRTPAGSGADGVLRVGLTWSAGDWNPSRSIPVVLLRQLLEEKRCEFWNLEGNVEGSPTLDGSALQEDLSCRTTLLGMAKRIAQLDLVITVDSLAAHMAGAMGIPVWVLLPRKADWRWMMERDDSPWYPTMRLFRKTDAGGWDEVVKRAHTELCQRIIAIGAQRVCA